MYCFKYILCRIKKYNNVFWNYMVFGNNVWLYIVENFYRVVYISIPFSASSKEDTPNWNWRILSGCSGQFRTLQKSLTLILLGMYSSRKGNELKAEWALVRNILVHFCKECSTRASQILPSKYNFASVFVSRVPVSSSSARIHTSMPNHVTMVPERPSAQTAVCTDSLTVSFKVSAVTTDLSAMYCLVRSYIRAIFSEGSLQRHVWENSGRFRRTHWLATPASKRYLVVVWTWYYTKCTFQMKKIKICTFFFFKKNFFDFEFCSKNFREKCTFWLCYAQILKCVILYEKALIVLLKIKLKNIFVKVQSCPVTIVWDLSRWKDDHILGQWVNMSITHD